MDGTLGWQFRRGIICLRAPITGDCPVFGITHRSSAIGRMVAANQLGLSVSKCFARDEAAELLHDDQKYLGRPGQSLSSFKVVFPPCRLIRLNLEWIVQIRISATHSDPETGQQVGGYHERSPTFVLPDMDSLMSSRHAE